MRKEVKLGMGIGGGVVALLVVYLLVAPPSGGKKGVELVGAGGNGNGNLADPALPADANSSFNANVEQAPVNGNALVDANLKKVEGHSTRTETGSKPAVGAAAKEQKDQWTAAIEKNKPATTPQAPAQPKDERPANAAPAKLEQSGTVVADAGANRGQTHLYFDPKGAWGGGVSSDAASLGAGRTAGKGNLIAQSPTAKGGEVAAQPVGRNQHVVKSGETFSSIAQMAYGSAAYYPHVMRANPGLNPNNLKPGLVINLPPAEEVKASAAAEKSAKASGDAPAGAKMVDEVKIDASRQYRVVAGDSLYKIGQKLYGTGVMGDKIYEMNRQVIGSDPKRLKLGMVLELPQPPTAGATAKAAAPQGTRSTAGNLEEAWNSRSSNEPFFGDSDPK
jgi:nucleoid-associated protein YgaU